MLSRIGFIRSLFKSFSDFVSLKDCSLLQTNEMIYQLPLLTPLTVPLHTTLLGLFTVAIVGPLLGHFQTHFRVIFEYLAEEQTKRS